MKRISYSGESVVTGDDIASALVDYAAELGRADSSDSVTIPTRTDSGASPVTFLIGPASQIVVSDDTETEGEELVDTAVVDELNRRRQRVGPPRGMISSYSDESSIADFPDFA